MRKLSETAFRPSRTEAIGVRALRTLLQMAAFWGTFLFLFPWLVVLFQKRLGMPFFDPGTGRWSAICVFASMGGTAIWSAWLFVRHGGGTPLPLDQTTRLVVLGPYRVVRNPMAICGITQGIMVGLYLGSWLVLAYAVLGVPVWHFFARPPEEADMARRFGEEYAAYAKAVPLWIPNLRPYPRVVPKELEERS